MLAALSLVVVALGAAPTSGASAGSGAKVRSVVIDTDMTIDDWMAVLFLVNRTDVRVKAITVPGTGIAHGAPGARNAIRLLDLAGKRDIPVAYGRATTYPGGHAFPPTWRKSSDELLGVPLPAPSRAVSKLGAARLMLDVVKKEKVEIVTLGPLTNIADTLRKSRTFASRVTGITLMGGALNVAGNVPGSKAEWNFYADPRATDIVLRSGIPWMLVPLDATNTVPQSDPFFERLGANATTASARFVHEVMSREGPARRAVLLGSPRRRGARRSIRRDARAANGSYRHVRGRCGADSGRRERHADSDGATGQPHGVRGPLSRRAERVGELARRRSGGQGFAAGD